MANVTKYDIAFIGVRLLAIYVALGIISSLPNWVMTLSMLFSQPNSGILKLLVSLLPLVSLLIPVFLWVLSSKIASLISKTQTRMVDTSTIERSDIDDLQVILFRVIGIFILVTTIPQFIAWIYAFLSVYIKTPPLSTIGIMQLFEQGPSIITLIVVSLKILLSIALIFTAKNLSMFFYKLRNAGLKE